MEDFRMFDGGCMWILIIIAFFLLTSCKGGCGGGFGGFDCIGNLFGGCGDNTWMWIIIAVIAYLYFTKDSCGSIFRNDIQ